MVIGREQRRQARRERFENDFAASPEAALDLVDLSELAWHDCFGEVTFPDDVLDDMLVLADGSVEKLASAALLAVTDWRDLRVAADDVRSGPTGG